MPPNFLLLMADQLTAGALPAYGGPCPHTAHRRAGAARRGVRVLLLQQPAVRTVALFLHGGAAALEDRRLRQCRGVPRADAHLRALPAPRRLPDGAERQDALLRARPAARLRGAADDRYLPGRFRLDARLDAHRGTPGAGTTRMDSVTQAGPCVRTNQIDFDDEVVGAARQKLFDIARSRDRRPFCLRGVDDPPARPLRDSAAVLGPLPRQSTSTLPRVGARSRRRTIRTRGACATSSGSVSRRRTQRQVRAARRAYLGAVSYVDDQVGALLARCARPRLDDNTIVLLLADHGDMLGERGLWYKMNFFEPACRIPLIVQAPGRFAPRRVPGHASLRRPAADARGARRRAGTSADTRQPSTAAAWCRCSRARRRGRAAQPRSSANISRRARSRRS